MNTIHHNVCNIAFFLSSLKVIMMEMELVQTKQKKTLHKKGANSKHEENKEVIRKKKGLGMEE
jgi:hypothetical protein